jgi:hypothetical protein
LILEHDVEACDQVADEILSTKAYGDAGESSKRQDRRGVNPNYVRCCQQGNEPDDLAACAIEDASKSTGLLLTNLRRAALGSGPLDHEVRHGPEEAVHEQRDYKYGYEVKDAESVSWASEWETGHRFSGRKITLGERSCAD